MLQPTTCSKSKILNLYESKLNELLKHSACEIVNFIQKKEISPVDLVEICAHRIEEVEPHLNALPTLSIETAKIRARELANQDFSTTQRHKGYLAGLPVAIKDLMETKGIRTTFGSPIYSDYIPAKSDFLVNKIEQNDGIVIAKSNTPEFGAGASTFNEVFGITRNPWNTKKSVAGSSGGACAAVASGEVWLATGSDLGGSLRTPASFNSVVGLRPSPGRIPRSRDLQPFDALHVQGPIARNCKDLALFLDAMSGYHPSDLLSYPDPKDSYLNSLKKPMIPKRIGYSTDLGITHVDSEVATICKNAVQLFEQYGTIVEENSPNFGGAIDSFSTLRAFSFSTSLFGEYTQKRNLLKPEVIWNIEQGLKLTAEKIGSAVRTQTKIFRSITNFFQLYDLLICPCAIVPPFDAEVRYVESVGDHQFSNYFEWIAITFALTLTGCPVLAVPAGFTKDGLPVGIQILGRPKQEEAVLSAGYLLEQITGISAKLPIDPINH